MLQFNKILKWNLWLVASEVAAVLLIYIVLFVSVMTNGSAITTSVPIVGVIIWVLLAYIAVIHLGNTVLSIVAIRQTWMSKERGIVLASLLLVIELLFIDVAVFLFFIGFH